MEQMEDHGAEMILQKKALAIMTILPSGLRRWLKAPFRKGVGSNPTAVTFHGKATAVEMFEEASQCLSHNAWLCEVFML